MYDQFFAYARERQSALLKKRAGIPKGQQSDDPIISHYKFCNVFREDDRTTIWLRENVRERMVGRPELLLATILFRWFNRIETGEAIFTLNYPDSQYHVTAWDCVMDGIENGDWDTTFKNLRAAILLHRGSGPYVTGAYCIIGMPHMSKLDGILTCVRNVVEGPDPIFDWRGDAARTTWRQVAEIILENPGEVSMESVWDWFRRFPRSGDFMAYEVVTDLQNTLGWLDEAPDRYTWANAGPGAIRGLNRIHGRSLEQQHPKQKTCEEMQKLLAASGYDLSCLGAYWPADWPDWDMRTVEHTLCEFDKYERLRLGEGKVKGVYR